MSSHQPILERRAPTVPKAHSDLTLKSAAAVGVGGFAVAGVVTGLFTAGYDPRRKPSAGWPRSTPHTPGS